RRPCSVPLRKPAIEPLHLPVLRDFHVRRFEDAMDYAILVCSLQHFADAPVYVQHSTHGDSATTKTLLKRVALDEFEHETTCIVSLLQIVNRSNVRMIQRSEQFRLALKPARSLRISREFFGKYLYRDFALQLQITCAIPLAHAAFAEEGGYLVGAEL